MEDQLVLYTTAKLAYEKGFDVSCPYRDTKTGEIVTNADARLKYFGTLEGAEMYKIPSQSLLQKWLRNVHDIHISLQLTNPHDKLYSCNIGGYDQNKDENVNIEVKDWLPYEKVLEEGLLLALRLINANNESIFTYSRYDKYRKSGMIDINGLEIIEGHIINGDGYNSNLKNMYIHTVAFYEGQFGSDIYSDFEPLSRYDKIEVIAHIEDYRKEIESGNWEGNIGNGLMN